MNARFPLIYTLFGLLAASFLALAAPASAEYMYRIPLKTLEVAPSNPLALRLTTEELPEGMVGAAYSFDFKSLLSLTGDVVPAVSDVQWRVASGALPQGLLLDGATGMLTGTPQVPNKTGAEFEIVSSYQTTEGRQVYVIVVNGARLLVTSISASGTSTCAVTLEGGVKCWGANNFGQLGDGTTTARTTPVNVIGLSSGVKQVEVNPGSTFACAVLDNGQGRCWGRLTLNGNLGTGTAAPWPYTPVIVSTPASTVLTDIDKIALGADTGCALRKTGAVRCWGDGRMGELGDGVAPEGSPLPAYASATPVQVQGITSGATDIAAGNSHFCAVHLGAAKCWGTAAWGETGVDGGGWNQARQKSPRTITAANANMVSVALGLSHSCGLNASGGVICWGHNGQGQLGFGNITHSVGVQVNGLTSGVTHLTAGLQQTCAVKNGGAYCWGRNDTGQLGDGTAVSPRLTPVAVSGLPEGSGVQALFSKYFTTCARIKGTISKCWGVNSYNQMLDGTTTTRNQASEFGEGAGL